MNGHGYAIHLGSPNAQPTRHMSTFLGAVIAAYDLRHYAQTPLGGNGHIRLKKPMEAWIVSDAGRIDGEEMDRVYREKLR